MKTFGNRASRRVKREDFELWIERGTNREALRFTVAPILSATDMLRAMAAQHDEAVAIASMLAVIRKCLVDDDGVPALWEPNALELGAKSEDALPGGFVLEVPQNAETVPVGVMAYRADDGTLVPWPDDTPPAVEAEMRPPSYAGPDGKIYLLSDAGTLKSFQVVEAGSSRRRWNHLMQVDDTAVIQAEDLAEIGKWVIGLAANRPTGPSASS